MFRSNTFYGTEKHHSLRIACRRRLHAIKYDDTRSLLGPWESNERYERATVQEFQLCTALSNVIMLSVTSPIQINTIRSEMPVGLLVCRTNWHAHLDGGTECKKFDDEQLVESIIRIIRLSNDFNNDVSEFLTVWFYFFVIVDSWYWWAYFPGFKLNFVFVCSKL